MASYSDLSKEQLVAEIKRLKKRKKFGLTWEAKLENVVELCKEQLPILVKEETKEIITDNGQPTNILIEGDNYHALSVLNYTHQGKIDLIYIDPPYNTGNKDFIYNDKFVDAEDPYRHSKWISFMEKRLMLAKHLLKKDGVIFISIDDNEQSQLKLLCNEVFNERNFVATIIWQRAYSPKNQSKRISVDHEYILAYAKNIEFLDFKLLPRTEKMNARYKNPDKDPRGNWKSGDLVASEERRYGHYIITGPHGNKFDAPPGKHWSFGQETMMEYLRDKRLYFGKDGKAFPSLKQFLNEVQQGRKASTLFFHDQAGHNDEAKKELKEFFEQSEDLFSTPKPTRLIKQLMSLLNNNNAVVLDFMAGSGTTGQAVLDLNKEDGSSRQFILCTNNENSICSDVCYPRIKKVITGYKTSKGQKVQGLGGNLKYFKMDFVDGDPTDKNKKKLTEQATEMLCLKEGTFEKVTNKKTFKIYKNADHYTGIIIDQMAIPDFKETIAKIKGKFSVYVFSLGDDSFEDEFDDVKQKVKLSPIPEVILRVYRRIFK